MAQVAADFTWEQTIGNSLVVREPIGVVGAITPWNYPLHQIAAKVAPALAAGCTVVLKPSEVAPLNAFVLAEIFERGRPARRCVQPGHRVRTGGGGGHRRPPRCGHGLVHRFDPGRPPGLRGGCGHRQAGGTGTRREVGQRDPRRCRPVPGGARRGPQVLHQLGADLQRPDPDAGSPGPAVRGRGAGHGGGASRSPRGIPSTRETRLGPLVSAVQRDRVRNYIDKGIGEGARLLTGGVEAPDGLGTGFFVRPTVFSSVTPDMTIARDEIFGPVLAIIPYDSEDEAVEIANDTEYGLAGGVWSADPERAKAVARRLRTGQVEVNGGGFNPMAPFGGYKQSGNGREFGSFGLEEFLEVKSLQL